MRQAPIRLDFGSAVLTAVPSIHYRVLFALEVNRLFSPDGGTPDAVAVELGDFMAQAARRWIGELCGPPGEPKPLPVMLGLARQNTRIRASRRDEALKLQQQTSRELADLPPELLRERLGFFGQRVLYLSPTDSIVEAIRCSWEHDLPLYGVDLEHVADDVRASSTFPDPWQMEDDLYKYATKLQRMAAESRDSETDSRRELAMAARLKTVLSRHKRVVFVCGLGHWVRLEALLQDPNIKPALLSGPAASAGDNAVSRVLVHPSLAVSAIDLWPAMARLYETGRVASGLQRPAVAITSEDARSLLRDQLQTAYCKHLDPTVHAHATASRPDGPGLIPVFERFLENLCLLHHRRIPDLPLLLKSARTILPPPFVETLTDVFMDFAWADPAQYRYPMLRPQSDSGAGVLCTFDRDETPPKRFCVRPQLTSGEDGRELGGWWWSRAVRHLSPIAGYARHTWGPWDYLASGLSLKALQLAGSMSTEIVSECFIGGHVSRADMKATMRSYIRGEDSLYVQASVRRRASVSVGSDEADPVVWILGDKPDERARWSHFSVSLAQLAKYAGDQESFAKARRHLGDEMVALVTYGVELESHEMRVRHDDIACQQLEGFVLLNPICWKLAQFARWAEATGFRRNPFCHSVSELFRSLPSPLNKLGSLERGSDWKTALILMAVPFARQRVVVVADNFAPQPEVVAAARQHRIELHCVASRSFQRSHIERLKWNYLTPVQQLEPDFLYPDWVEEALGESQYLYRDMVPETWLHFGEVEHLR